jgi:hypothetical protein
MFLLRLNRLINPALACRTSLTAKVASQTDAPSKRAEFYKKIARGIKISKALYANEYNDIFRLCDRSQPTESRKIFFRQRLHFQNLRFYLCGMLLYRGTYQERRRDRPCDALATSSNVKVLIPVLRRSFGSVSEEDKSKRCLAAAAVYALLTCRGGFFYALPVRDS